MADEAKWHASKNSRDFLIKKLTENALISV
ncbi:hypothetical protein AEQU2_01516 [Aequorivita lipolytica]|nr:hypothetical protein AEQU2_01516 [Aequorivita lipolytica]